MYFDPVNFGKRIQQLRKSCQLSQVQLAMALSISTQYLSNIEIGERMPALDLMIQMAEYFHVSLDYLILGISTPADLRKQIEKELELVEKHLKEARRLLNQAKRTDFLFSRYIGTR